MTMNNKIIKEFRQPIVMHSIFFLLLIGCFSFLEYRFGVDKETIIVSISALGVVAGYFITHLLDVERKKLEEKAKLYQYLVLNLRIFMTLEGDVQKRLKDFEDKYYKAWLYISTPVYETLISYIEEYKVYDASKTDEDKKKVNKILVTLMQAIRDEFIVDKKANFVNYILQ